MSTIIDAHDPSVGVGRRHLPSFAGEEVMMPFRNMLQRRSSVAEASPSAYRLLPRPGDRSGSDGLLRSADNT